MKFFIKKNREDRISDILREMAEICEKGLSYDPLSEIKSKDNFDFKCPIGWVVSYN